MAMDKVVAALAQVAVFAELKPLQISEIARHARKLKFLRGDIITKAGQPGEGAYLIVSGPAERLIGRGVGAQSEPVVPGSLIGEMAMLVEHDYGSTVVARDWVYCVQITRAGLHQQMLDDPTLTEHFQRRITDRLLHMRDTLRQIDGMLAPRDQIPARARLGA